MTQIEAGGNSLRWAVVTLWLICSLTGVSAQDVSWERATTAGLKAFEQRHYTEAARHFQTALAIVETVQPDDPRLANSLMRLAVVYHTQGRYAEAEPLYQRAVMIQEQMFGPDNPQIVELLEAYATLQRRMRPFQSLLPWSTANKLAARARQIRERAERLGARTLQGCGQIMKKLRSFEMEAHSRVWDKRTLAALTVFGCLLCQVVACS